MGHRIPLSRTSVAIGVSRGALLRDIFNSPVRRVRRTTSHILGLGTPPHTTLTRRTAKQAASGLGLPS
jgi:hypothetical protein